MITTVLALIVVVTGIVMEVRKNGLSNLLDDAPEGMHIAVVYALAVVGVVVGFFLVKGTFATIGFFIKTVDTGIITIITFLGGLI